MTEEVETLKTAQRNVGSVVSRTDKEEIMEDEATIEQDTACLEDEFSDHLPLTEYKEQINVLSEKIKEKEIIIHELERSIQKKDQTAESELDSKVTSLESQKMALETKINYLQKQANEVEILRSKLQQVSSASGGEVRKMKQELQEARQKLELTEMELIRTKQELEALLTEVKILREENQNIYTTISMERTQLETQLTLAEAMIREERERVGELRAEAVELRAQVDQMQKLICDLKMQQTTVASPGERKEPIVFHDASVSMETLTLSSTATLPRRSSKDSTAGLEQSIKALKSECERLALENSRLKISSQIEYIRNIILRYLQLPEQKKTLLPVLANVLRFSDKELASIPK